MEYHDQPLQYVNRYYFHTKTEDDEHYAAISTIMLLLAFIPLSLFMAFFMITIIYIPPILAGLLKKLSKVEQQKVERDIKKLKALSKPENKEISMQTLSESSQQIVHLVKILKSGAHLEKLTEMEDKNSDYVEQIFKESSAEHNFYIINLPANSKFKIYEAPLFVVSMCLNVILFAFHIVSAVEIIEYGAEVLQSDYLIIVVCNVTVSIFVILVTYIVTILLCIKNYRQHKKYFNARLLAATSIMVNFIHLICYFMPYVLFAFIYNPLQTCVTYLALGIYILCGYLFFWVFKKITIAFHQKDETDYNVTVSSDETDDETDNAYNLVSKNDKWLKCLLLTNLFIFCQGLITGVMYFSFAIIYVLTLGSFDDFEVIQNLVPPLLIGVFSYFIVNPTFRQAKQKFSFGNDDSIPKLLKEEGFKETFQNQISLKKNSDDTS